MAATKKATEKKRKPLHLERDDIPEALHVALRKLCDSTPTSILWNLIYIMDQGIWGKYLDYVYTKIKIAEGTGQEYWLALKEASLGFENEMYRRREPKIEGHSLCLMNICFEQFEEFDWKGYAGFIEEY